MNPRPLLALCALALCGCSSWPMPARVAEGVFIAECAVDGYQTSHFQDHGGDTEQWSRSVIGRVPSTRSVAWTFALEDGAHVLITNWLVHHAPSLTGPWEVLSISAEGSAVSMNFGVRL
ncbi:MAG: hypothetical protein KGL39_38660 [Patescibacteria group bacterium]|nr:hypothetical protein [Patescibacteria group bacterium]